MSKKDQDDGNVVNFSQRKRAFSGMKRKQGSQAPDRPAPAPKWIIFLQLVIVLALIAYMLKQCSHT